MGLCMSQVAKILLLEKRCCTWVSRPASELLGVQMTAMMLTPITPIDSQWYQKLSETRVAIWRCLLS